MMFFKIVKQYINTNKIVNQKENSRYLRAQLSYNFSTIKTTLNQLTLSSLLIPTFFIRLYKSAKKSSDLISLSHVGKVIKQQFLEFKSA